MTGATGFSLDVDAPNVMPSRYRQVAIADLPPDLDDEAVAAHFVGREAYMRTVFVVARRGKKVALVELARDPAANLFSNVAAARVVAAADECRWINAPDADVGIPSQMATVALANPDVRCVVVEGRYGHVSFLLNPRPLVVDVIDIVPPSPSKLVDQARRVLDLAEDLAPVVLREVVVDSRELLAASAGAGSERSALLPCRVSGDEFAELDVAFLDQRPAHRDWTLLGCQRSQEIHRWFYGESAPMIDTCPRRFLTGDRSTASMATLTRCCLLQEGIEHDAETVVVPWGASLDEVRIALVALIESLGVGWTPT